MRSEKEMFDLILATARSAERIRAVILNGSRANPHARRDIFQDFDIVYIVTDVASFKNDPAWIEGFGELMIMQLPDDMVDPLPEGGDSYAYLMQFADGNRIDLSLFPAPKINELEKDSLSVLLLDKDGIMPPLPLPNDRDYLPKPPTAKAFADCCNEFWWVAPYVAKGLWRAEILYAKYMFEITREQLLKMLAWHIGFQTQFGQSPGKYGRYFQKFLEPELWDRLQRTFSDAGYENTWEALFIMCDLFRTVAVPLAMHFGFEYPTRDDERVTAHLHHVRQLPREAKEMY